MKGGGKVKAARLSLGQPLGDCQPPFPSWSSILARQIPAFEWHRHSKSMQTVGFNAMKLNTISSPTVSSSWAGADGRTC